MSSKETENTKGRPCKKYMAKHLTLQEGNVLEEKKEYGGPRSVTADALMTASVF